MNSFRLSSTDLSLDRVTEVRGFIDNLNKGGIFTLNLNMKISRNVPTDKKRLIVEVWGCKGKGFH